MTARHRITEMIYSEDTYDPWQIVAAQEALEAEVRSEVLLEAQTAVIAWLQKKAREYRATRSKEHVLLAETIELMADKVRRGAVRVFLDAANAEGSKS